MIKCDTQVVLFTANVCLKENEEGEPDAEAASGEEAEDPLSSVPQEMESER